MSRQPAASPPVRRIDRILAVTSLVLIAVSIGCFVAVIIAGAVGITEYGGAWPLVFAVQMYGPILGFGLLLVLLIMSFVRRGRANRQ